MSTTRPGLDAQHAPDALGRFAFGGALRARDAMAALDELEAALAALSSTRRSRPSWLPSAATYVGRRDAVYLGGAPDRAGRRAASG